MTIGSEYLNSVIKRFQNYRELGEKTFAQLSDEHFQLEPNSESNSIAVIIQHMHGNMLSRWTNFLTEDGEKTWRERDEEFEKHSFSRSELIKKWDEGWNLFIKTLESLKETDLLKTVYIRKEPMTVIDAINRQLAHYSYHVGQIVYLGRWVKKDDWKSLSIPKKKATSQ
jgi:uncharacterized damage-inducible protein DinB